MNESGISGGYSSKEAVTKDTQTVTIQPIAIPAIPVDELRDITDNFGTKALIGEGSYGKVYHGVLASEQAAAIKKLDSSKQPNQEFLAQVLLICYNYDFLLLLLLPCDFNCLEIDLKTYRSPWYQDWNMKILLDLLAIVSMALSVSSRMSTLPMDLFMIYYMVSNHIILMFQHNI